MGETRRTAYAEFGIPSISDAESCRAIAGADSIFPLKENDLTVARHAFKAWEGSGASWACTDTVRDYFGEAETLEQLAEWSQWLQGEGCRFIFEEARRQKPYCSMAINWCFNEPLPALANCSIINFPATPKNSYFAVADACRPALISARITKFVWRAGETFSAALWLLNDGREPVEAGTAHVSAEIDGAAHHVGQWRYGAAAANANAEGPAVSMVLPRTGAAGRREMRLLIQAGALSSAYRLLFEETGGGAL
jgi:beta-mannosidase